MLYEWRSGTWVPRMVLPEVDWTHSLRLVDFDRDGHLDIVGKPYSWEAPRLDVWLNDGPA